jgi:hypothetical protein
LLFDGSDVLGSALVRLPDDCVTAANKCGFVGPDSAFQPFGGIMKMSMSAEIRGPSRLMATPPAI